LSKKNEFQASSNVEELKFKSESEKKTVNA